MTGNKLNAQIFSLGVRAIYVGPAFNVSAHRVGVAVLCCGVAGSIEVACDARHPSAGWVTCRTLLIPAGRLHLVRFRAEPIACLYLDPQSTDTERIARAMNRRRRAFATDHASEAELLALLWRLVRRELTTQDVNRHVAKLLHLSSPTVKDERVEHSGV